MPIRELVPVINIASVVKLGCKQGPLMTDHSREIMVYREGNPNSEWEHSRFIKKLADPSDTVVLGESFDGVSYRELDRVTGVDINTNPLFNHWVRWVES